MEPKVTSWHYLRNAQFVHPKQFTITHNLKDLGRTLWKFPSFYIPNVWVNVVKIYETEFECFQVLFNRAINHPSVGSKPIQLPSGQLIWNQQYNCLPLSWEYVRKRCKYNQIIRWIGKWTKLGKCQKAYFKIKIWFNVCYNSVFSFLEKKSQVWLTASTGRCKTQTLKVASESEPQQKPKRSSCSCCSWPPSQKVQVLQNLKCRSESSDFPSADAHLPDTVPAVSRGNRTQLKILSDLTTRRPISSWQPPCTLANAPREEIKSKWKRKGNRFLVCAIAGIK